MRTLGSTAIIPLTKFLQIFSLSFLMCASLSSANGAELLSDKELWVPALPEGMSFSSRASWRSMNNNSVVAGASSLNTPDGTIWAGLYTGPAGYNFISPTEFGWPATTWMDVDGINDNGLIVGRLFNTYLFTYNIHTKEKHLFKRNILDDFSVNRLGSYTFDEDIGYYFIPRDITNDGKVVGNLQRRSRGSNDRFRPPFPAVLDLTQRRITVLGVGGRIDDVNSSGKFVGTSISSGYVTGSFDGDLTTMTLGNFESYNISTQGLRVYSLSECNQISGFIDNDAAYIGPDGDTQILEAKRYYASLRISSLNCSGVFVGAARYWDEENPLVNNQFDYRAIISTESDNYEYICNVFPCGEGNRSKVRSAIKVLENGDMFGLWGGGGVWLIRSKVTDSDQDGILDDVDNCPSLSNAAQNDLDNDGIGDACDSDIDGDLVDNDGDNCPLVSNQDQLDADADLIGDACDDLIDNDADGIANDLDNCPAIPNADQANNDQDGFGDACDADDDNDTVEDTADNCPLIANEDQADNEGDNIGDVCDSDDDNDAVEDTIDNCPLIANLGQEDNDSDGAGDVCDSDDDSDLIEDEIDNCPLTFNPDQANTDGVGAGDACNDEFDLDDDDWENDFDNCPNVANRNQSDFDGDSIGDACDNDVDNDGVSNASDSCPLTPLGALVGSSGCSIEQLCPCDAPRQSTLPWKNHGQYVSCVTQAANTFNKESLISGEEKGRITEEAAQSACGF